MVVCRSLIKIPNNLSAQAKTKLSKRDGIIVSASIRNPKGQELTSEISFDVIAAVNPYFIQLDLSCFTMSSAGSNNVADS